MADLNTVVYGSSGTCRDTARWLDTFGAGAGSAGDSVTNARNTAAAGWWGPAMELFYLESLHPRENCDDLSHTCGVYAAGLNDFADSLDKVVEQMDAAIDKAAGGGLEVVDKLLIVKPDKAAMVGDLPASPTGPSAGEAIDRYNAQVDAYNARVDAYEAKRVVFNECCDMVKAARKLEDEAHVKLVGDLAGGKPLDQWQIGHSTAKAVLGTIKKVEGQRDKLLELGNKLNEEAKHYTDLANAKHASVLDEKMKDFYREAARKGGANADRLHYLINRFDGVIPERFRQKTTPPRRANYDELNRRPSGPGPRRSAGLRHSLSGKLGYLDDALTVLDHGAKVLRGEQSPLAGGIRIVGTIAAGTVGGAIGGGIGGAIGFAAGSEIPVVGNVVGAAVGRAAGAAVIGPVISDMATKGLDAFLQDYLPDHLDTQYNEEKAESAGHARKLELFEPGIPR